MANEIHPSAVIMNDVELGDGNYVGPFVLLAGPLRIGNNNYIGAHCVIGTPAEDAKGLGPAELRLPQPHGVRIGNNNVIRELTIVHGGKVGDTRICDNCWIHSQSHIDHDCILSDGVVLAPCVSLAGMVTIEHFAQIGMAAAIHQQRRIWGYSMIGMNATVVHNVPPFALVRGTPARIAGCNRRRLERMGISAEHIEEVEKWLLSQSEIPGTLPETILAELREFSSEMHQG